MHHANTCYLVLANSDLFFEESKTRVSYRAPLKDLLDEYNEGHSMKFTAFDPSLHVSTYANLWGTDLGWLLGVSGTTFLSNYNRTVITAPYHSAFWESFAYQVRVYRPVQCRDISHPTASL